jgi:hypothetical protein
MEVCGPPQTLSADRVTSAISCGLARSSSADSRDLASKTIEHFTTFSPDALGRISLSGEVKIRERMFARIASAFCSIKNRKRASFISWPLLSIAAPALSSPVSQLRPSRGASTTGSAFLCSACASAHPFPMPRMSAGRQHWPIRRALPAGRTFVSQMRSSSIGTLTEIPPHHVWMSDLP